MKTIEALISLMVLLSFTSLSLLHAPTTESHLYKYQLAEDVWRIAYLKGCFNQSVPSLNPQNEMEECLNPLIAEIERETSTSIAFTPLEAAGSSLPSENAATITKTVMLNGVPKLVQMKIG